MIGKYTAIMVALISLTVTGSALSQTYQIKAYTINSGGGLASGGSYNLNGCIGQVSPDICKSANLLHWTGFWAGEVPVPTVCATASGAKGHPDGTFVSVAGKIATSAAGDFSGFFYLEEADRSSGIRVAVPSWPVVGLLRGSVVNVIGTMATTAFGERQIVAPLVIITATLDPVKPLGMGNRGLGGSDIGDPLLGYGQFGVKDGAGLNNIGLLVKVWGRASDIGGQLYVSDGCGEPVRVDTSGLASLPPAGSYISVIGISSLHTLGADRLRLILPRDELDIQ